MIEELLQKNESNCLEFKENTTSLSGIIKTVIAFANTAGGIIIIGIQDATKKAVGVLNVLEEEEHLLNAISDSVAPLLLPLIEVITYQKKELIIITIPYVVGPYYIKSLGLEKGVFVRSGSTNRLADQETLESLKLFIKNITFDELPCPSTLDVDAVQQAFTASDKKCTKQKMRDLQLLVSHAGKEVPSQGAIILFGKQRLKFFPEAIIRCVKFIGTTKAHIFDHTEITSYPTIAIKEALHFIEKNMIHGATFNKLHRIDIPQYPLIALREAVINAVVHADYSIKGSSIMIAMFDDRIEISNPGGIPFGITLERALAGSSRIRNRVIARVFRELALIEQWGSGLQRIIEATQQRGLKKPLFEDFSTEFKVTLYATKDESVTLDVAQEQLVTQIKKQGKMSTKEAAHLMNIAPRNARTHLKRLVDHGILKRIGSSPQDPHGYYMLVTSNKI